VSKTAAKVAIVTGGARGIGRGCALELAARGYDIALVDLLEPEMKRTAGEIAVLGRKTLTYQADVALFARAHEVAADVQAQWGHIDFLLNDAGASNAKGILEIKEEEFDRTIAVNLKSCFNYIHAIAPIMLEQEGGGRIVSMSSLNALSGGVTSAVSKHSYATAKAGILGLTRSLAKELGPKIMINAVCPGVIETELGNSLTKARGAEMVKGIMLDRLGTPADVAQLVAFLATSEPCFITGQHFVIDGFQWSC
jgi:3-oxoacyl-[acyl-carrier protein] reductase